MSKKENPNHETHAVSWSTISNHSYQQHDGQVHDIKEDFYQNRLKNGNKFNFEYEDNNGEGDNCANEEDDYYGREGNQKLIKKKRTKKKLPHMISEHDPSQLESVPYMIQSSSLNICNNKNDPTLEQVECIPMTNHEMYNNEDNMIAIKALGTVFWGRRKSRFMNVLDIENFNGTLGPEGWQFQLNERKSLRGGEGDDDDNSQHSFLNEVKKNGYNDENDVERLKGNLIDEMSVSESEEKSSIFISDDSQGEVSPGKKKKKDGKKILPSKNKSPVAKRTSVIGNKAAISKSPVKIQNKLPTKPGNIADKNQVKKVINSKSPPNKNISGIQFNQKKSPNAINTKHVKNEVTKNYIDNKKILKPLPLQQLNKQNSSNHFNNKSSRNNELSNSNSSFPNEQLKFKFNSKNNKQKGQSKNPNQKEKEPQASKTMNISKEGGNHYSISDLSDEDNELNKKSHRVINRNKNVFSNRRILSNKQSNASTGFSKNLATPTSAALKKAMINKTNCNVIDEKGQKKNYQASKLNNHNQLSKSPENHKNKTDINSRDNSANQRSFAKHRNHRRGQDAMSDDLGYTNGQYPLMPLKYKRSSQEDLSQTHMFNYVMPNNDRMMSNLTYKYYDEKIDHYKHIVSNPFNPYSSYYNSRFLNPKLPEIRYDDKAFSVMMPNYKDKTLLKQKTAGIKSVPNIFLPKGYNTSNTLQSNTWGVKTTYQKNNYNEDMKSNFFIK